jgi:hypothetical protein
MFFKHSLLCLSTFVACGPQGERAITTILYDMLIYSAAVNSWSNSPPVWNANAAAAGWSVCLQAPIADIQWGCYILIEILISEPLARAQLGTARYGLHSRNAFVVNLTLSQSLELLWCL